MVRVATRLTLRSILARLAAGTACDWIGPRWTMVALLSAGAIPVALAGTITNAAGLCILRFFIGIIGGCFVPTVVWTTAFFDKNIVGTANALTAGFGNAGSGIAYFVMPAVFDSLVKRQHLTEHVAWRVTFLIPFVLLVATIVSTIFLTTDTPTGDWSARALALQRRTDTRDIFFNTLNDREANVPNSSTDDTIKMKSDVAERHEDLDYEAQINEQHLVDAASWELVKKPTRHDSIKVILSLPTLAVAIAIFSTFGPELAVNSFLGAYYYADFPSLGQSGAGAWAAMYGLLNFVFRPWGGVMSDLIYRYTRSLWSKKILIVVCGVMLGIFSVIIGVTDQRSKANRMGLVTALAFFSETGSGAIFSLTPHIHPTSNGEQTFLQALQ